MSHRLPLVLLLAALTTACGDDDGATNDNNTNQGNGNNQNGNGNQNGNATEFDAVPGQRCARADRVGTVSVYSYGGSLEASAAVYDRPEVLANAVALEDAACTYHEALAPGFCDPACDGEHLCDHTGTCQPLPAPVAGLELRIHAGAETQTLLPEYGGTAWGAVTLPGRTFAATVTFGGLTVRLAETAVPEPVADLLGTMQGTSEAPTGLDFAWTPPGEAAGAEVHTLIPINHHAGGPTYTECAVPASAGAFSVTEAMLMPLAVITGLEFQGLEHARVAAAQTPAGCVEFRWQVYQQPQW